MWVFIAVVLQAVILFAVFWDKLGVNLDTMRKILQVTTKEETDVNQAA